MQTQEILLAVFTGILAIAVLVQTFVFLRIYLTIRQLTNRVDDLSKDLMKNVEIVTAKAEEILTTIRDISDSFTPVKNKMVDAVEIVHERVLRVDEFLEETTNTARMEVKRIRDRIESASDRTEEFMEMVHDRILVPVSEITALDRGIRAGFDFFFRRHKTPSVDSQQDEEMFI
jgi:vacuolar-type H+-ATPase subunit I/STV1